MSQIGRCRITTKHSNRVHITWDVLYIRIPIDQSNKSHWKRTGSIYRFIRLFDLFVIAWFREHIYVFRAEDSYNNATVLHIHILPYDMSARWCFCWLNLLFSLRFAEALLFVICAGFGGGVGVTEALFHLLLDKVSSHRCMTWRHQMETFSALLAFCAGNSPITGDFPAQRPVTQSFDVFFDLRLNRQLSKQRRHRWFETPSRSLWRHCKMKSMYIDGFNANHHRHVLSNFDLALWK